VSDNIEVNRVIRFKDATGLRAVPIFYNPEPLLKEIIREALEDRKREQDRVYIVCGDVGKGKSLFCLWNSSIHDDLTKTETPISNITRNLSEFEERLSRTPKGSFLTIDEGSELSSERHGEKQVKIIKEKFTVMRKKSHLIYICFTNPLRINSYFREDRFRGIFVCKKIGVVYYYSASRYFDIIADLTKDMGNSKATRMFLKFAPNYILFNVPEYKGRLRKAYEDRKDSNIDDKLMMSVKPSDAKSLSKTAAYLGISRITLNKYIKEGVVEPIVIGTRKYLDRDSVEKLRTISKGESIIPSIQITTVTDAL